MKNIAVINLLRAGAYTFEAGFDSKSAFEVVLDSLNPFFDAQKVVVLCQSDKKAAVSEICSKYSADIEVEGYSFTTDSDFFQKMRDLCSDYNNLFHIWGDAPCIDLQLSEKVLERHKHAFAEYTFADGYVSGVSIEAVSAEIFDSLIKLSAPDSADTVPARDIFFETIKKDINAFDIETLISLDDMRNFRIGLYCDTKEHFLLSQAAYESCIKDAEKLGRYFADNQQLLRTIPAYVQLQVSAGCLQSCSYCPYPAENPDLLADRRYMSYELFDKIVSELEQLNPEFTVSVSLRGEPSLNPEIYKMILRVLGSRSGRILIETSGLGWKLAELEKIAGQSDGRVLWIVSLDSDNPGLYSVLRGTGMGDAFDFYEKLYALFPSSVWAQSVRMNETEQMLEGFFRKMQENKRPFIVQKYNDFSGALDKKKVVDLSPVKRFACWHLKREMAILHNGDAVLCANSISPDNVIGNVIESGIQQLFEKGGALYNDQLKGEYPGICGGCDEYYTFNF